MTQRLAPHAPTRLLTPAMAGLLDRLRAAGVTVVLVLVRGVTHDFTKMWRVPKEAALAHGAAAAALAKAWKLP